MNKLTRRAFLEQSMIATLLAIEATERRLRAEQGRQASPAKDQPRLSPNERITVAVIGVRGRGADHARIFASRKDCQVLYLCDCDRAVGPALAEKITPRPKLVEDMREIFEDPRVDVVSIATPDHWHALAAIWAMQKGKDVYVEKPVSHNIWEGRRMVQAMQKYLRICQAGTQHRSTGSAQAAAQYIQEGKLGKIDWIVSFMYRPRSPIGPPGDYPIPETVNYDLWCGPAPMQRPLRRKNFHYDWHWFWDYGNGELGNNGIHAVDLARKITGLQGLGQSVLTIGARHFQDAGETPNSQLVIHDFGQITLVQEIRNLPSDQPPLGAVVLIRGEAGYLVATWNTAAVFDREGKLVEKLQGKGEDHFANFLRAVWSRNPADLSAPILEGHISTSLTHLGKISYRLSQPASNAEIRKALEKLPHAEDVLVRWESLRQHLESHVANEAKIGMKIWPLRLGPVLKVDSEKETFIDAPTEATALLRRQYRPPYVVPEEV
ncbi:MAG: Gfo/Idh/MocA family oxidoreductase [Thermoguttaceae bacterium]|nr:Gfo/Idh/MocA family oxidoreductase [Thermoguttaceae bacterium]MDW8039291.1 Gfo/Idh/MocA family oxidoreductase [Thermoguttaceae bacterium]